MCEHGVWANSYRPTRVSVTIIIFLDVISCSTCRWQIKVSKLDLQNAYTSVAVSWRYDATLPWPIEILICHWSKNYGKSTTNQINGGWTRRFDWYFAAVHANPPFNRIPTATRRPVGRAPAHSVYTDHIFYWRILSPTFCPGLLTYADNFFIFAAVIFAIFMMIFNIWIDLSYTFWKNTHVKKER